MQRFPNLTIDRELAKKFILWSISGNDEDKFRYNDHLFITLILMFYCGVKPEWVQNITRAHLEDFGHCPAPTYPIKTNGGMRCCIPTKVAPDYCYIFDITNDIYAILQQYIKKYNIPMEGRILQVELRSVRKVFEHIAAVYHPGVRMTEVYWAGRLSDEGYLDPDDWHYGSYGISDDPYRVDRF